MSDLIEYNTLVRFKVPNSGNKWRIGLCLEWNNEKRYGRVLYEGEIYKCGHWDMSVLAK